MSRERKIVSEKLTSLEPVAMSAKDMEEDEYGDQTPSGSSTPNLSEAVDQIKRSLSISALQEMSAKPSKEVRRSIQNKLWRPHDDEARLPSDWERLIVHVFRAGSRAFMLSYGLRSTISFLVVLIKALRTRKGVNRVALKNAYVGEDTTRFALMFGVWAAIYKFVNNALRLLTPMPVIKSKPVRPMMRRTKTAPASTGNMDMADEGLTMKVKSKKPENKKKMEWQHLSAYDPRVRSWHAYVAGALSSVAFLIEKPSFVQSLGMQLFVRGLEGSYRQARSHGFINIPHGAILVFGLANIQIMLSWLGARGYLNRGYRSWIDKASGIPKPATIAYESGLNNTSVDPWALVDIFGGKVPEPISQNPRKFASLPPNKHSPMGVTGETIEKVYQWMERGELSRYPTCALAHPYSNNHLYVTYQSFVQSWKFIMPVYLTLYIVPAVFLRPKSLLKSPKTVAIRSVMGASRSSAFLAMYTVIYKTIFCLLHEGSDQIRSSSLDKYPFFHKLSNLLVDHRIKALPGFMTGLSLLVEHRRRRSELSAYVLPKALETFWKSGRSRGIFPPVPYGEYLIAAASLSMIMGTYAHNPENLSHLVSRVIYQFIGRN